jgi:hypothetical protein
VFKLLSVLACLPMLAWTQGDFSAWKDSTRIFMNTTPTGANVTSSVFQFPLLVRLDSNSLNWSNIRNDGADLRFRDPDGTVLPYEVELFDPASKKAAIWVRVPLVDGLSLTDHIVMYWNNSAAISLSDGGAVFDTSLGYAGIWHFGEEAAGVGEKGVFRDATRNGNHGDDYVSADRQDGVIGFSQRFDGADDRIQVANNSSLAVPGPLSMSAWVKASRLSNVPGNANPILRKGDANPNSYQLSFYEQRLAAIMDAEDGQGIKGRPIMAVDRYYHVAATWESKTVRIYINGVQDTLGYTTVITGNLSKDARPLYIGGRLYNPNESSSFDLWNGDLDEVRLSRQAHTPQHVKLSYENQKAGSTILTFSRFPVTPSLPVENTLLWSKSRKIRLNTTASGAGVAVDVKGFPALVRLDTSVFRFGEAHASGRDIRFTDPDGSFLKHHVERWDALRGLAEIWVKVPQVDGNGDQDHIRMHWGNPDAGEAANSAAVFDSVDGFRGVWHLNQKAGGSDGFPDATGYGNPGRDGVAEEASDALIGEGATFLGEEDRITIDPKAHLDLSDALTLSAWIRGIAFDTSAKLVNPILRKGSGTPVPYQLAVDSGYLSLHLNESDEAGNHGQTRLQTGRWHHVAATWGQGTIRLFVDGKPDLVKPIGTGSLPKDARALFLGGRDSGGGEDVDRFHGSLDEVRVSAVARSPEWIKLSYENQKPGGRLLVHEGFETRFPGDTSLIANPKVLVVDSPVTPARLTWSWDTTLAAGEQFGDSLFWVSNPGPGRVRVIVSPADNRVAEGVIGVQATFRFTAVDGNLPRVQFTVDPGVAAGRSLYQVLSGTDGFGTLGDWGSAAGAHDILYPGTYTLAKDTSAPRLRVLDEGMNDGDSSWISFRVEDNIKHVFIKCFPTGTRGLPTVTERRESGVPFRLAFQPTAEAEPLKVSLSIDDGRNQTGFPPAPSTGYVLARNLPGLEAPVRGEAGLQWTLFGLPVRPKAAATWKSLSASAGAGKLYGGLWVPDAEDPTQGDYRILQEDDTVPTGKGLWLAGEKAFTRLPLGASRSYPQGGVLSYSIPLRKGWNLLTSPALEKLPWVVTKKDLPTYDQSPVKGLHAHGGSEGYADADTLEPWKGYFVYSRVDTVLSLTPEGPLVFKAAAKASRTVAASASTAPMLQVVLDPLPGVEGLSSTASLRLGAAAYAEDGLAMEDEFLPTAPRQVAALGVTRDRKTLRTDLLAFRSGGMHAWKIAWRGIKGRPDLGRLRVSRLDIPDGFEARAASRVSGVPALLVQGSEVSLSGDVGDTLVVWAAPKGSWRDGDPLPGLTPLPLKRGLHFRDDPEGGHLRLALPEAADLSIRLHSADGRSLGRLASLRLAPGHHAVRLPLAGRTAQGLLLVTVEYRDPQGASRSVLKILRP